MREPEVTPFYERVRLLLQERGISHHQIEYETGMSRAALYSRYKHQPSRSRLMALAYYFGMTVEELVDGTDAMDDWYR